MVASTGWNIQSVNAALQREYPGPSSFSTLPLLRLNCTRLQWCWYPHCMAGSRCWIFEHSLTMWVPRFVLLRPFPPSPPPQLHVAAMACAPMLSSYKCLAFHALVALWHKCPGVFALKSHRIWGDAYVHHTLCGSSTRGYWLKTGCQFQLNTIAQSVSAPIVPG